MNTDNRWKFRLDVRTKFILLIITSIVIQKASCSGVGNILMLYLAVLPFLLLLLYKLTAKAFQYLVGFVMLNILSMGMCGEVLMGICGIFVRILPVCVLGYIFVATTRVNEYTVTMDKMKIPVSISIPVAVLFRFFPTLKEEYHSISNAMKMRGIRFGGKHPGKMLEYRMIPFLMSGMKIGEELSAAALTRGLGAPVKRTSIAECGFCLWDAMMLVVSVIILLLYIAIRFSRI